MKKWLIFFILALTATSYSSAQATNDDTVTIYFARHGKTILNTADRVQGWIDSPLTAEGRQVAQYLGEGLKGIKFDQFYTSDAGRQRETMKILLKQLGMESKTIHEDENLREAFFGGYEGGFNKDMADASAKSLGLKDGKELFAKMKVGEISSEDTLNSIAQADPTHTTETYLQVKTRTQKALNDMVKNALANGDKTILAVSSGTSMQIMISDLTDNPDKNKPLSNATIVKITYHNGAYTVNEIGSAEYINLGKQRLGIK